MLRKGAYKSRSERLRNINDRAAKVWQAEYDRALGWSPDPDGDANKVMHDFLRRHGAD